MYIYNQFPVRSYSDDYVEDAFQMNETSLKSTEVTNPGYLL